MIANTFLGLQLRQCVGRSQSRTQHEMSICLGIAMALEL